MADAWSGIMLFLEYQEGKDRMQLKKWCDQYPKHVALVLRLTEMLYGKGHIVYGDSYFTSVQTVKTLLEHGTYYLGMLKTASAGFPKKSSHLHGMMMPHEGSHVQFNTLLTSRGSRKSFLDMHGMSLALWDCQRRYFVGLLSF